MTTSSSLSQSVTRSSAKISKSITQFTPQCVRTQKALVVLWCTNYIVQSHYGRLNGFNIILPKVSEIQCMSNTYCFIMNPLLILINLTLWSNIVIKGKKNVLGTKNRGLFPLASGVIFFRLPSKALPKKMQQFNLLYLRQFIIWPELFL